MSNLIAETVKLFENAETIKSDLPSPHVPTENERHARDREEKKSKLTFSEFSERIDEARRRERRSREGPCRRRKSPYTPRPLPDVAETKMPVMEWLDKVDEYAEKFATCAKEVWALVGEHIDLSQQMYQHHQVTDKDGKFIAWDGQNTELMKDRLAAFLARVKKVEIDYMVPVAEVMKIVDHFATGKALDEIVMGEISPGVAGWGRGDLNPPQPTADDYPEGPNNDEEEPLEYGQDSSPIQIDPPLEPYSLDGGIQTLKPAFKDPRLSSPEFNHRHPIRRRAAGLGILHTSDRAAMDATPSLTNRQWGELESGNPDQSTLDDMLTQLIAAQQAGLDNAYKKMLDASGLSLAQAIEALQKFKRDRQNKGPGDTAAQDTVGNGPSANQNLEGGAYQS